MWKAIAIFVLGFAVVGNYAYWFFIAPRKPGDDKPYDGDQQP